MAVTGIFVRVVARGLIEVKSERERSLSYRIANPGFRPAIYNQPSNGGDVFCYFLRCRHKNSISIFYPKFTKNGEVPLEV